MSVVLEVINAPTAEHLLPLRLCIDNGSATIGRNPECDLSLPCPEKTVSRLHGEVVYEGGACYLIDKSANGIYINQAADPLGPSCRHLLKSGDLLDIGPFTVMATVVPDVGIKTSDGSSFDPAGDNLAFPEDNLAFPEDPAASVTEISAPPTLPEIDELLGSSDAPEEFPLVNRIGNDFGDIEDQFSPPSMTIPADWDLDPLPPIEDEKPVMAKAPVVQFASRNTKLIEAFLEGLGVANGNGDQVNSETMRALGECLKASLDGFIQSRSQVRLAKSKLSFDKISLDRQQEADPLGDITDSAALIALALDHHNPQQKGIAERLGRSFSYCVEDIADVLEGHQVVTDRYFKELSPEAIEEALIAAQQEATRRNLSLAKINDGFSSSSRKWVFFQRNWKKIFARANASIKKDFESKFLLSHVRRMGARDEAK